MGAWCRVGAAHAVRCQAGAAAVVPHAVMPRHHHGPQAAAEQTPIKSAPCAHPHNHQPSKWRD
eukprot:357929-Chlamydomonas_euryale.AAC.2